MRRSSPDVDCCANKSIKSQRCFTFQQNFQAEKNICSGRVSSSPITVAARFKTLVCGRSLAVIADSNSPGIWKSSVNFVLEASATDKALVQSKFTERVCVCVCVCVSVCMYVSVWGCVCVTECDQVRH
jgi:hypothetical protein